MDELFPFFSPHNVGGPVPVVTAGVPGGVVAPAVTVLRAARHRRHGRHHGAAAGAGPVDGAGKKEPGAPVPSGGYDGNKYPGYLNGEDFVSVQYV